MAGLNVIGNLGDPQKDAAAFQPVVDEAVAKALAGVDATVKAAVGEALAALDATAKAVTAQAVAGLTAAAKSAVDEAGKVLGDTLAGFRVVVTFERIPPHK